MNVWRYCQLSRVKVLRQLCVACIFALSPSICPQCSLLDGRTNSLGDHETAGMTSYHEVSAPCSKRIDLLAPAPAVPHRMLLKTRSTQLEPARHNPPATKSASMQHRQIVCHGITERSRANARLPESREGRHQAYARRS